ncbi:MAG: hypothetical protein R2810_15980 [Flavobacteriales bacterium]
MTAYVRHERSYDAFVPEDSIGCGASRWKGRASEQQHGLGLGPTPMHDHPNWWVLLPLVDFQVPEHSLKYDDSTGTQAVSEQWLYLPDLHGYCLAQGDEATALARPGSIVLSRNWPASTGDASDGAHDEVDAICTCR